jgi:hypothetical protein
MREQYFHENQQPGLRIYLGATSIDEIRSVLQEIAEKTGFQLKLVFSDTSQNKIPFNVNPDKLDKDNNTGLLTYEGLFLSTNLEPVLSDALHRNVISYEEYHAHIDDGYKLIDLFIPEDYNMVYPHNFVFEKLALVDAQEHSIMVIYANNPDYDLVCGLALEAGRGNEIFEYPMMGSVYLMAPDRFHYSKPPENKVNGFEVWLKLKQEGREAEFEEWFEKQYGQVY